MCEDDLRDSGSDFAPSQIESRATGIPLHQFVTEAVEEKLQAISENGESTSAS
jgi:hypothetical protein